ncbi:MAG TPA: hypothetical protein DCM38_13225, partial [Gammaproteobacteria bacterium]|nr:hypothetical protein [Gammaproteobacteria bacterium]
MWMNDFFSKLNRSLIFIILIILAFGLVYSLYLGDNLRYIDEQDYYEIAENLSSQFHYALDQETTAFRPPGYPILLSVFLFIGADIFHLRMLNFIFLSLTLILLFEMLKTAYSQRAAIISAFLVIGYPVLLYTASTLYPQIFGSFLFILFLFLLIRETTSNIQYLTLGIIYAILVLTIPIFLLLLPIIVIWMISSKKQIKVQYLLIFCITLSALIGSWTLRNYLVFDRFILLSSNAGINLLLGNSEKTQAHLGTLTDISKYLKESNNMSEVEKNAYYTSEAIHFMLINPLKTTKLYVEKFVHYFNYTNRLNTVSEKSKMRDLVMLFTYGTLLFLFCTRLFLFPWYPVSRFEMLLLLLYFGSGLAYAIFFTRIRFRLPFDFLLISMVAIFLENIILFLQNYKKTRLQ